MYYAAKNFAMSLLKRGDIVSKHHKRSHQEQNNGSNSLLGNIDINQVIQLLGNMSRKAEPQNPQSANGLNDGIGALLQTFLSSMKRQEQAVKSEEVVKPEEIIVENDEPVQVYSNEELSELIEQLKTLIATLQNNIEHKEDE